MNSNIDLSKFDFSGSFKDINKGLIVKPFIQSYLYDGETPEFTIHVDRETRRAPDGWFHPSQHPIAPEGYLYQYLMGNVQPEVMTYESMMAVSFGTLMHTFLQACFTDSGIRPAELQVCRVCPSENKCDEFGVIDADAGERGHVDGILDLSIIPDVPGDKERAVLELKSVNAMSVNRLEDMNLEQFKAKYPVYYGQQQSYLRMSGLQWSIVIFVSTSYPFEMKEYHIPFDPIYSSQVFNKYVRVRKAIEMNNKIPCCGSKGCAASNYCKEKRYIV